MRQKIQPGFQHHSFPSHSWMIRLFEQPDEADRIMHAASAVAYAKYQPAVTSIRPTVRDARTGCGGTNPLRLPITCAVGCPGAPRVAFDVVQVRG